MTGPGWGELVTTALLGTDRRPLPPELLGEVGARAPGRDPADILLSAAARYRAVARASAPLERCAAPPVAPPADLPDAPAAAQQLLHRLLARPLAELVNAWSAAAAARAVRAAPEHWSDLAALAATRPDYDRGLLARALGRQGSWFVDQNPDWQALAAALRRELAAAPGMGPPPSAGAVPALPVAQLPGVVDLRARPEAAFDVPAPWPRALTVGALQVLLGGQLGWRASRYGAAVGARMAAADADLLLQAAEALAGSVPGHGPGLRLAGEALAAVEESARARAEIDRTFDPAQPPDDPAHPSDDPAHPPDDPAQPPDDPASRPTYVQEDPDDRA